MNTCSCQACWDNYDIGEEFFLCRYSSTDMRRSECECPSVCAASGGDGAADGSGWRCRVCRPAPEQERFRCERQTARSDLKWARDLDRMLQLAKGDVPKGTGKRGRGASEHALVPRPWWQMSHSDRWYLEQLWNGSLLRIKDEAETKCREAAGRRVIRAEKPVCDE